MNTALMYVPCDPGGLVLIRRRLRMWLSTSDVPVRLREAIVLGVNEAVVNAIRHAEPSDSIGLRAAIENGVLTIDVTATGSWNEQDALAHADEGRGLLLIRELLEHVEIRPDGSGTTVHLRQTL